MVDDGMETVLLGQHLHVSGDGQVLVSQATPFIQRGRVRAWLARLGRSILQTTPFVRPGTSALQLAFSETCRMNADSLGQIFITRIPNGPS